MASDSADYEIFEASEVLLLLESIIRLLGEKCTSTKPMLAVNRTTIFHDDKIFFFFFLIFFWGIFFFLFVHYVNIQYVAAATMIVTTQEILVYM